MKETEEYESVQESPVSHADTRSVELVRLNDRDTVSQNDIKNPLNEHFSFTRLGRDIEY